MNIIARLACFLFIFINAASCRAHTYALTGPGVQVKNSVPVKVSSFFSGKKARLEEQSPALHPFLTVSAPSFMLGPGSLVCCALPAPLYNRHKASVYSAVQAWGIVAGLKAKMLFPVHYFW